MDDTMKIKDLNDPLTSSESLLDSSSPSNEQVDPFIMDEAMRSLKATIKSWERDFLMQHHKKPTKEDVLANKDILELYKQYSKMKSDKKTSVAVAATEEDTLFIHGSDPSQLDAAYSNPEVHATEPSSEVNVTPTPTSLNEQRTESQRPSSSSAGDSQGTRPHATSTMNKEEVFRQKEETRARALAEAGKIVPNPISTTVSPKKISLPSTTTTTMTSSTSASTPISPSTPSFPSLEDVLHPTLYFIHPDPSTQPTPSSTSSSSSPPPLQNQTLSHSISTESEAVHDSKQPKKDKKEALSIPMASDAVIPISITTKNTMNDALREEGIEKKEQEDEMKEQEVEASSLELNVDLKTDPLDLSSLLASSPEEGTPFLGYVERFRHASRPTLSFYRFHMDANPSTLASARRELKLSLTPTYYVFDHANAAMAPKQTAKWKIKGNFEGSLFRITECLTGNLLGLVYYTSSVIPRAMTVVFSDQEGGHIPSSVATFLLQSNFMVTEIRSIPYLKVLKNKLPKYHEDMKTYCLNFQGRVTMPSVKNFQLYVNNDDSKVVLQFGRTGKETFSMDVHLPVPLYMALAICLTSFDAVEKV